jgi:thiazole/oxazole-forming peptide maturase SagC family component
VTHDQNVVELRRGVWNPVSITLSDQSGSGKLARALELLSGELALEDVARKAGMSSAEAGDLVSYLSRHNLLETAPASAYDALLDLVRGTLADFDSGPKFSRMLMLGDPDLAASVATHVDDIRRGLSCDMVSRADIARLTDRDLTLSEDPLAFREEMRRYEDWRGAMLLWADWTINPILLRNLNRVCLHHRVTWLPAVTDGPLLMIGPTITPHSSACYECFESRVLLNMRENDSYLRYKKAVANHTVRFGTPAVGAPFRALLSSLTAIEVANLIVTGSNFTAGRALSIYLPALGFSFNEVLRVPGCAACSPVTEQHEQGLYFDLRGLVNNVYQDRDRVTT